MISSSLFKVDRQTDSLTDDKKETAAAAAAAAVFKQETDREIAAEGEGLGRTELN